MDKTLSELMLEMNDAAIAFMEKADEFVNERRKETERDKLRVRNRELALENERLKNRLHYTEEVVEYYQTILPKAEAYPCSIDNGASTRKSVMSKMADAR